MKIYVILILLLLLLYMYQYYKIKGSNRIIINNFYNPNTYTKPKNIPYQIIQTVKDNEMNEMFYNKIIKENMKLNPEFSFNFYTNDMIERFLQTNFEPYVFQAYKKINPDFGACLSDFARYCLLYVYGGVYFDIKSVTNRSIKPLLEKYSSTKDALIVSHWLYSDFFGYGPQSDILPFKRGEIQNWVIIATPRHPVLKKVIDEMIRRIHSGMNGTTKFFVLKLTGPIMFSEVIFENLNDVIITDDVNDYFSYTKFSLECLGDCKGLFYDKNTHYSKINKNVIR